MARATISSGSSLSAAVDLGNVHRGSRIVGIVMPSAWDAANLTFQVSADNSTFVDLYDSDGTELTVSAAASRGIGLTQNESFVLSGWRFIKVRSGTSALPVNQSADRDIEIVVK